MRTRFPAPGLESTLSGARFRKRCFRFAQRPWGSLENPAGFRAPTFGCRGTNRRVQSGAGDRSASIRWSDLAMRPAVDIASPGLRQTCSTLARTSDGDDSLHQKVTAKPNRSRDLFLLFELGGETLEHGAGAPETGHSGKGAIPQLVSTEFHPSGSMLVLDSEQCHDKAH